MATSLLRAQLLQGNILEGDVLADTPQGVTAGNNVVISSTGQISIAQGAGTQLFVATNNPNAYNDYVWTDLAPPPGDSVLRITGGQNVDWIDISQYLIQTNETSAYNDYRWPTGINTEDSVLVCNSIGQLSWQPQTTNPTGTVTSVGTGTGLVGGPITTSGSISLANTTVSPGTYTAATLEIDAQGRITSASSGTGAVTSVSTGTGLTGGGGPGPVTISLNDTSVVAASYTNANITVDQQGRITSASNGSGGGTAGVTSLSAGTGITLSPNPITDTGTISNSGVTQMLVGRGLKESNSTGSVTVELQDDVIATYDPLTFFAGQSPGVTSDGSWSNVDLGTWNFSIPDGPDYAVFIYSGALNGDSSNDVTLTSGSFTPAYKVASDIYCQLNNGMQYTGGQSGSTTSVAFGNIFPQVVGKFVQRNVRVSLVTLPGGGNRSFSINWYSNGSCSRSVSGGDFGLGVGGVQAFLLPFESQ